MAPVPYLDATVARLAATVNMLFDEPFIRWDVLARLDCDAARVSQLICDDDRDEVDQIATRLEVVLGLCDLLRARWRDDEPDDFALRRASVALLSLHGLRIDGDESANLDVWVPPFAADEPAAFIAWQQSALRGERPELSEQLARVACDEWERRALKVQWRGDEKTVTVVISDWEQAMCGDEMFVYTLTALLGRYGTLSPEGRPDIAVAEVPLVAARWVALAGLVTGRWTGVVIPDLDAEGRETLLGVLAEAGGIGELEAMHHLLMAELAQQTNTISVTGP